MRNTVLLILAVLALAACSPARHLPEDQHLLHRNRIHLDDTGVKKDDLRTFIRQKPNRRILGFYRFHLHIYQLADRGRETGIRGWMKNTIGEPPVIFDSVLASQTNHQFGLYMQSKGYFNADVSHEIALPGRRAIVTYRVEGNTPYTIHTLSYHIPDTHLANFVYGDTANTLVRKGERYDADILQDERIRVSRHLQNQGFYQFSREFIFFRVDSTVGNNRVDIEMLINDPQHSRPLRTDDVLPPRHRRYIIDDITVYPDFSPFRTNTVYTDTTRYRISRHGKDSDFLFLHEGPMRIRPRAIIHSILIDQGDYFSISDVDLTYSYLSRLRNFRFINLQFTENENTARGIPSDTLGFLHTRIDLTRSPANAFTVEAEGMNTSGNLGVAGNIIYHNRNIFRGAEVFNLRLKGALEITGESRQEEVIQSLPFNTVEIGAEASVDLPKLLSPIRMELLSRTARPKSTIMTGINFRQRPDYTRYIYNLSYGFEWSPDPRKRQYLYPVEISTIKVFNDSLLQAKIPDNNPLILSRFKNHLITGSKYSYFFSNQQLGREVDFIYFRGNIEFAGNLLFTLANAAEWDQDNNGSYRLFNIPFAQYVKGDADFRYYRVFNAQSTMAFRAMAGVGIPYGNVDVLPFIKSYYGGGANSLRAWKIYSLGPGGYQDSLDVRFDRYGDIKLEANVEYRFSIYRFWKAAFFADAGNVWFLNENPQFPGGEFDPFNFYKEIAIGTGAGIRLDFDFFIIRLDAAFPIRNPALPPGDRWVRKIPGLGNWNFNLGIGYPF